MSCWRFLDINAGQLRNRKSSINKLTELFSFTCQGGHTCCVLLLCCVSGGPAVSGHETWLPRVRVWFVRSSFHAAAILLLYGVAEGQSCIWFFNFHQNSAFKWVCVRACMYVCVRLAECVCVCVCARISLWMWENVCVRMWEREREHVHILPWGCVDLYVSVCMHLCVSFVSW